MRTRLMGVLVVLGLASSVSVGFAQKGKIVVPDSTVEHAQDIGLRAHTNHLIFLKSSPTPQASSPSGMVPATIRNAYNLPAQSSLSPGGAGAGTGVIAIVDAFDYPTAQSDFDTFSNTFGLPTSTSNLCNGSNPCFVKVYATGTKPRGNCGWAQEMALDIEWSHAMAPYAQIVLVEAKSNSFTDLFNAIDVATRIVTSGGYTATGGTGGYLNEGEVSNSWGGSEFSSESSNDFHFASSTGVVYFASSGDTGGKVIYPSASPNVVSAGGTTLNVDGSGNFLSETAWSSGGGGPSAYESIPSYQSSIAAIVGSHRGTPDFSFDANPNTGVSVYDSTSCQGLSGWLVFGGTSVASPSLSGIVNSTGRFYSNSVNELSTIYSTYSTTYGTDYRDITSGSNGFSATTGWDFATGVGSNLGLAGK